MHNNYDSSILPVDKALAVKPLEKVFSKGIQPIITAVSNDLINIIPSNKLLPLEIKLQIFFHFSLQDWISLFKVSQEWRILVISLAAPYLDSVKGKVDQIEFHGVGRAMKGLIKDVEQRSARRGTLPPQFEALKQLEVDITSLSNPLAQLLHCKKKISEIKKEIEKSYRPSPYMSSFFPKAFDVKNSELYSVLDNSFPQELILIEEPWFKNARFCAGLAVNHSTAKFFAKAFLEIKKLNNPANDAQDVHKVNTNSL